MDSSSSSVTALPQLLVKIQSIDLSLLEFGSGKAGTTTPKSRYVTCVEFSNTFLLAGTTSGSVYVFNRDSLSFLFLIPFKGGKVCNVAISADESSVAVASIRGKLSIYKISDSSQISRGNFTRRELFKHLYDVQHHVQNEITEIHWSCSGRFLFIGDNQGLISQTDLSALYEFPRPPPSTVILKLKSRVLQIDCSFPYLAICTMTATYLCDLEKEDFTRVLLPNQTNIQAGGLCFYEEKPKFEIRGESRMILVIGEMMRNAIYLTKLDGNVVSSGNLQTAQGITRSTSSFDPDVTNCKDAKKVDTAEIDDFFIPGKIYCSSDNLLISVNGNRLAIFDPLTARILLWNDSYNRINSLKVIGNYGFLWCGNKVEVLAVTNFVTYGRQLFKAGLKNVLVHWIEHTLSTLGYNNSNDKNLETSSEEKPSYEETFRKILEPALSDDEFCDFVAKQLNFPLKIDENKKDDESDSSTEANCTAEREKDSLLDEAIKKFKNFISKDFHENSIQEYFRKMKEFYEEFSIAVPVLQEGKHPDGVTLIRVLRATHFFIRQKNILELSESVKSRNLGKIICDDVARPIFTYFKKVSKTIFKTDDVSSSLAVKIFTKFSESSIIWKYFEELKIPAEIVRMDAVFADLIVLLEPLVDPASLIDLIDEFIDLKNGRNLPFFFCTWLSTITCITEDKGDSSSLPYASLLRPIQNVQIFEKLSEEILASIYRDSVHYTANNNNNNNNNSFKYNYESSTEPSSSPLLPVHSFTNFVTFAVLFSQAQEVTSKSLSLLLKLFPIKRASKSDIVEKLLHMTRLNSVFLEMLQKACVGDGNSLKLCKSCGIQATFGNLNNCQISHYQRSIEEAILRALIDRFLEDEPNLQELPLKSMSQPQLHIFAIRRALLASYFENCVSDEIISDNDKIISIFRSGLCSVFQHLKFNKENLTAVLKEVQSSQGSLCACAIDIGQNSNPISMDCVGVWIFDNCQNLNRFMKLLQMLEMNVPGLFTSKFYKLLITRQNFKKGKREDFGFGNVTSLFRLTCHALHSNV